MAITRATAVVLAVLCGCASSQTTTGLSSAPKLGTSASRARAPYDVVADGHDSCERAASLALPAWSRSPPCVGPIAPAPVSFATPRVLPSPTWVPRSRWSLPACWTADDGTPAATVAYRDGWACMH